MYSKGYIINKNNIYNDNDENDNEPARILIIDLLKLNT